MRIPDRHFIVATLVLLWQCAGTSGATIYSMPQTLNLTTHARVDPTTTLFDDTSISLWRIATPGETCSPVTAWDGGNWTGLSVPAADRASDQAGLHPTHFGSTVVQYEAGAFGTHLNLYDTPPTGSLGTVTVEYTWSQPRWVAPWPRGLSDATRVECTMDYQAPTAAKTGVAIYSSWSLGFHAAGNASQYVWYETELFDLGRAFSQVIWSEPEEEGRRAGARVHSPLPTFPLPISGHDIGLPYRPLLPGRAQPALPLRAARLHGEL